MMNKKTILICAVILGAGVLSFAAYSKITAPSTYEECVLQHINEAKNETAATLVSRACRAQFPNDNPYAKFIKPGQ